MSIEWRVTSIGPSGSVYFDLFIDNVQVRDMWIAELVIGGVRHWSFRRAGPAEKWGPLRDTLDEAKADAAMYFAKRELEKH